MSPTVGYSAAKANQRIGRRHRPRAEVTLKEIKEAARRAAERADYREAERRARLVVTRRT